MITLIVDKVAIAENPIKEQSTVEAIQRLTRKKIESCSEPYSNVVSCDFHPLVGASHVAYDEHRPLVISPDMIWMTIAQGISYHVNANAEKLRKQFVNHAGKKEIVVRRDGFLKGSRDNDWSGALNEFSTKIEEMVVPSAFTDIRASFSTTSVVERTAYDICLMGTVKNYFRYTLETMCGIPTVEMEGTIDDWKSLQDKVESLKDKYDLAWWFNSLIPVVTGMAESARSKTGTFWKNWYKLSGGSGGPYIQGHITKLFPYLKNWEDEDNITLKNKMNTSFFGTTSDQLPGGLSSTPFIWEYYEKKFSMLLMSGFIGFTQDSNTMAIRPKIGWAVMDEDAPFEPLLRGVEGDSFSLQEM